MIGLAETLLQVRELKVHYYTLSGIVRAVEDVDLDVGRGEWVSVVGESGSGKTTLAFSITRLVPPPGRIVGGSIVFDGLDLARAPVEKVREVRGRRIAMIFQDPGAYLDPLRRVGDQIAEAILEHRLASSWGEAWRRAQEALEEVGIPASRARFYPHQLSGGQRQRVAIASAIALEPDLLVADEPTTALDVVVQARIMEVLGRLKRRGLSILMITHDIALAREVSDRIAVMYAGRIVEEGPSESIVREPQHPYTQALIESLPDPWERKTLKGIPGEPPDLRSPPGGCPFHPRCPLAVDECRRSWPAVSRRRGGGRLFCHVTGG